MSYGFSPYVPVAKRRERAQKKIAKLRKSGRNIKPIEIEGRKIAKTFWGDSWCKNLESYSDYSNRLPRGRTYVRNGSVVDLQIEGGTIGALVNGSEFYKVEIAISPLSDEQWEKIKAQCAGKIDSLVELLQGAISQGVMQVVTQPGQGLFPLPAEITYQCSCPDWAGLCKHIAASLYGVGARLDKEPEMLFALRGVRPDEMISLALEAPPPIKKSSRRILNSEDVASVFGFHFEDAPSSLSKKSATKCSEAKSESKKTQKPAGRKKSTKKVSLKKPKKQKKSVSKKSVL